MSWPILVKMSHFGDPTYPQNIFYTDHWIFLVKVLLLSTYMTTVNGKTVKTQKLCSNRLNYSFLVGGSYSYFLIWWIFSKLAFFGLFWVFLLEHYTWPHLKNTGKVFKSCSINFQKIVFENFSSFSRKCENPSKSLFFWGGRNWG